MSIFRNICKWRIVVRYLGNKDKLHKEILNILAEANFELQNKIILDLFTGTGSVAKLFSLNGSNIIMNDYLFFSYVISQMYFFNYQKSKEKMDSLITLYNDEEKFYKGYIYKNYSENAGRKYFSDKNAMRIDFIRNDIDKLFFKQQISKDEQIFLLGLLIEGISKVSNIAGVYGSFLKKEDPRFFKNLFLDIEDFKNKQIINEKEKNSKNLKVDELIGVINEEFNKIDLAYLDPPYTVQQYSHQYHLLETIAKNEKSEITGITGSRSKEIGSSNFSRKYYAQVEFQNILLNLKAENFLISYSNKGIINEELMKKMLRRVGETSTLKFKKILYKKYLNSQTENKKLDNFEFLFFIKKKKEIYYESPLNYSGSKFKLVAFIKSKMPKFKQNKFIDLFGGGFNVGINMEGYNLIIYNDLNFKVVDLLKKIREVPTAIILKKINFYIKKFSLEKNNKESYLKLREFYNKKNDDSIVLLCLIFYGFANQIRFNNSLEFNNPVGRTDFNSNLQEKLISFSNKLKKIKVEFNCEDYFYFEKFADESTFFYLDPPYLITTASYNDGRRGFKGWTCKDEKELLHFIDIINSKGAKFMLSNVLEHKNKENNILKEWIKKNNFRVIECPVDKTKGRKEILVVNYDE